MAEEKNVKFRANFVFNLPESIYNEYMKVDNKTTWLTGLIKEHFDKNSIRVKIDDNIREKYDKDIYKDFRIQMLLLEFYNRGNINLMINNTPNQVVETPKSTSSDSDNKSLNISDIKESDNNQDVSEIAISDNTKQESQNNVIETKPNGDIIEHNEVIEVNLNENITENDEEKSIIKETQDIKDSNIDNDVTEISNNTTDEEKTSEKEQSKLNAPKGTTGSIAKMFKGGLPSNKKSLL